MLRCATRSCQCLEPVVCAQSDPHPIKVACTQTLTLEVTDIDAPNKVVLNDGADCRVFGDRGMPTR